MLMKLTKIIPSIQNPQFSATRTSLSLYHLHAGSVLQFMLSDYLLTNKFAVNIAPIDWTMQNKSETRISKMQKILAHRQIVSVRM